MPRHVLDHPDVGRGRCGFDLGAGSGLVAIALARFILDRCLCIDAWVLAGDLGRTDLPTAWLTEWAV